MTQPCLMEEYKRCGTPLPPWVDGSECTLERMTMYLEERLKVKLKCPPFLVRHMMKDQCLKKLHTLNHSGLYM